MTYLPCGCLFRIRQKNRNGSRRLDYNYYYYGSTITLLGPRVRHTVSSINGWGCRSEGNRKHCPGDGQRTGGTEVYTGTLVQDRLLYIHLQTNTEVLSMNFSPVQEKERGKDDDKPYSYFTDFEVVDRTGSSTGTSIFGEQLLVLYPRDF